MERPLILGSVTARRRCARMLVLNKMCCRKKRRKRFAVLMLTELVAQWINVAFFIIPNVYLLARPCDYFSKIVREPPCPCHPEVLRREQSKGVHGASPAPFHQSNPVPGKSVKGIRVPWP